MSKTKRILALLLALTMMSLTMAACQSGNDQITEPGANDNPVTDEPAPDDSGDGDAPSVEGGKLIYWDKSEYVAAYNDMMKAKVDEFADANGIDVDYVILPSNDQKQKVMAAIEANNAPDLFVSDDMLCAEFVTMGQIANVSDVLATMDLTGSAAEISKLSGEEVLVPLSMLAPGCYWRKDVWEANGLDKPVTWDDFLEDARVVNDPTNGFYALGFPMGASGGGDAESMMRSLILSFGGVPVDEDGNVKINSPETLAALQFMATCFEEGLTPPDAVTWDDAGNNTAYLAGTVGIVFNSGSIWSAMMEENEELLNNSEIIAYPSGPSGRNFVPGGSNTFAIFETGANTEVAKEFVKYYFSDLDYYNSMIEQMGGMWQPVVNGLDDTEFWADPMNAGWLANAQGIVRNFHPAPADELANLTFSNQLCVKAMQKIIAGGMDPQQALDELEAEFNEIYAEA